MLNKKTIYVYKDEIHNEIAVFNTFEKACEHFTESFGEEGEWQERDDDFEKYWKVGGFSVSIYSRELML